MKVEVCYTARFRKVLDVGEGECLSDLESDIVPGDGEYVENSFEVMERNPKGGEDE